MELTFRHKLLFSFILLFILFSFIQDSYAKYLTTASADTNLTIARWNILVNTRDVVNNSDFSNYVAPIFPGNTHISSGIIAPTSEGYFDISIDNTAVDVSFDEVISIKHTLDNTISDLIITGYSLNGGSVTSVNSSSATINKTILITDSKTHTYRIYVKWIDGGGESMNNTADTQATKNGKASMEISVSFTQKAS